jgi:hypothetical protein
MLDQATKIYALRFTLIRSTIGGILMLATNPCERPATKSPIARWSYKSSSLFDLLFWCCLYGVRLIPRLKSYFCLSLCLVVFSVLAVSVPGAVVASTATLAY